MFKIKLETIHIVEQCNGCTQLIGHQYKINHQYDYWNYLAHLVRLCEKYHFLFVIKFVVA